MYTYLVIVAEHHRLCQNHCQDIRHNTVTVETDTLLNVDRKKQKITVMKQSRQQQQANLPFFYFLEDQETPQETFTAAGLYCGGRGQGPD